VKSQVKDVIRQMIQRLKENQTPGGYWDYPFETGISTDAYMIILLRTLEIDDEKLVRSLTERILSKQEKNGAWKLYHDEEKGNLTATVEAYYALLYSGYYRKDNRHLLAAKKFILSNGGIEQSHMLAKIMLSLTGQYPWPSFFPIPVEMILLPRFFPINFYDFSVYGRANLAPIMILAAKKYTKKTPKSPNLSHLFVSRENDFSHWPESRTSRHFFTLIEQSVKKLAGLPHSLHSMAIQRAKQYMLEHIERDGTLYSYFSSTFLMVFALLSLGHSKRDPLILKAVEGLKAMKCTIDGHIHMQYTTAAVWNTSLISYALQKAGIPFTDPAITKANQYLLERQHHQFGDWAIQNPGVLPGGWGFSHINTMNPDVDDSTATLRALSPLILHEPRLRRAWDRGIQWTISMQNQDGGWPAFEKNVDNILLNLLPIEGGNFLLTDPSSSDLTGRTLEFLGGYTNLSASHDLIKRGVRWLFNHQEGNGSWYGRWGICYIYGTWAAITGLIASNVHPQHKAVQKAVAWLHDIQNQDGGWGESCKSDTRNTYIPLGVSTLTHTAWALDALIAAAAKPTREIQAGINYLLSSYNQSNWTHSYPAGQGMGGAFYIHYHSYQYIFPLLALAHYKEKFL